MADKMKNVATNIRIRGTTWDNIYRRTKEIVHDGSHHWKPDQVDFVDTVAMTAKAKADECFVIADDIEAYIND